MVAHSPRINLEDLFAGVSQGESPAPVAVVPADIGAGNAAQVLSATASVATTDGPVQASEITVGTRVLTRDNGYALVAAIQRVPTASMVMLPAGLLGLTENLTIAADAGILLADDRFVALFGLREVMVPAAAIGHQTADAAGFAIVLSSSDLIAVDAIWTEAQGAHRLAARPTLCGREADIAVRICMPAASPVAAAA